MSIKNNSKTVLVANRGVVAKRIMQTCKEMGLFTVGIYSQDDPDMAYIPFADQVYEINGTNGYSGYLNKEKIIEIAIRHDAAIHPGYGFLSENGSFARDCKNANVPFIGPSPEALNIAGNKIACKELLLKNNIPVIPSFSFNNNHSDISIKAEKIGYPLIIKPAYGGGGIGMLMVNQPGELENCLHDSSILANQYFTDSSLLIEKYFSGAKHIEVQILGDHQGNFMHLFERECSLQRRNQKVIEESLSPTLDDDQREKLYDLALKIAKLTELNNIGTIEFLLHNNQFYFLEINPRLQVEHGVTEQITGIDLVEWQIRISNGETIKEAENFQKVNGHCIESRIYAEDPISNLPFPGIIDYISLPDGKGLRVESAIWEGIKIPELYDPLLMKLIINAETREKCRLKMLMALQNLDINGTLRVNTMSLLSALQSESFINGSYNINSFESLSFSTENNWEKQLSGILVNIAVQNDKKTVKKQINNKNVSSYWKPNFWK